LAVNLSAVARWAHPPTPRPPLPSHTQPAEVHGLQQQLAIVNDNPLLGLQESAELLAAQLEVDLAA